MSRLRYDLCKQPADFYIGRIPGKGFRCIAHMPEWARQAYAEQQAERKIAEERLAEAQRAAGEESKTK